MSIERRRHARIAVDQACVLKGPGGTCGGEMRDVSLVGARIVTAERPAADYESLELSVEPTEGRGGLTVKARVMYGKERDGAIVLGIQFLDMDAETHRAVHRFVEAALAGTGGGNREHPRVHHRLEVACRTPDRARAVLENVSKGGMGVALAQSVAVGDEITISVTVGRLETPLVLPGEVVRVRKDDAGRHLAGVRFGKLSPETEQLLEKLLAAIVEGG